MSRAGIILVLIGKVIVGTVAAEEQADRLRRLDAASLTAVGDRQTSGFLSADARARRDAANRRESAAWHKLASREEWEKYKTPRIDALRTSLGIAPKREDRPTIRVGKRLEGDGHVVEAIVYESRPGLWVSGNLYLPKQPNKGSPGILIVHSHHNSKTQGELQDMGVIWARRGCLVLVIDQVGHGERRVHPFIDDKAFDGKFRPGRQDYYFRYNSSLQLYAIGDSLMGWMVHDLSRGIDVLVARGADVKRIVLLGSVAGGGDPAGVTAALDDRIAAVAPFNFGGPQPESPYPLPDDAETRFNYAGGGSWESTRNLRLSARDGFLPWVIVGSVAPRAVIHAHEFSWEGARDPVWKRYQKIFDWYDAKDRLGSAKGKGLLTGKEPESSHCNNIGAYHRRDIYPLLKKWFGIEPPEAENDKRRPATDLLCWTPELRRDLKPKPTWEIAALVGEERRAEAKRRLEKLKEADRLKQLRKDWSALLGDIEPAGRVETVSKKSEVGEVVVETTLLTVHDRLVLPLVLLRPPAKGRTPVAVCVCQEGKAAFLKQRADEIAELLKGGIAVCLIDVRGTGETRPGSGRGRNSEATAISATEFMLGQTLVGSRLSDLRTVLGWLRKRDDLDGKRFAVWGESFAPVNAADAVVAVPLDADKQPHLAEPLGDLLAVLAPLFDESLVGSCSRGGLSAYRSLLQSPYLYVPHDAVIPGAIAVGDLDVLAGALGDRVERGALVDGTNRAVADKPVPSAVRRLMKVLNP